MADTVEQHHSLTQQSTEAIMPDCFERLCVCGHTFGQHGIGGPKLKPIFNVCCKCECRQFYQMTEQLQSTEAISDEDALRLRDHVVELMIADACKHMPSIKALALANTSAWAHARYLPMHQSQADGLSLRAGIRLGVLDPLGEGRVRPEGMA